MKKLISTYNSLINIGILQGDSKDKTRKIKAINISCLVISAIFGFFTFIVLLNGRNLAGLIHLIFGFLFIVPVMLNKKRNFKFSRFIFYILSLIAITIMELTVRSHTRELYIVCIMVLALFLSEQKKEAILGYIIVAIVYISLKLMHLVPYFQTIPTELPHSTVMNVLISVIGFYLVLNTFREDSRKYEEMLNSANLNLAKERDKSENLLLNILPYETAQELKAKGEAEAKLINKVTVLFTDFKGFTAMAEQLSPQDLVADLNLCFSEFDRIMGKYGIEKIKTIGDSYMAAGGLPTPNDTHATDVVKAALDIAKFIEEGKQRKIAAGLPYFEIRIGIHTGPVVAGIVGIKKFSYDIWGDTVNTASRMESSGEIGKINVSEKTYELIKDQFNCEYRGEVEAKGKGMVKMYFVNA